MFTFFIYVAGLISGAFLLKLYRDPEFRARLSDKIKSIFKSKKAE